MDDVTLYHGLASTCSKKVRIALYEKGVGFTSRLMDLQKFDQHDPAYLAINPKGVVPTLVHNGCSIVESTNIIQYVDEAFHGPALSPKDPVARSTMRLWLRFSDEVAYDAVYVLTWQFMRHRAAKSLAEASLKDTLSRIPTTERRERWEQMAKGGYSEEEVESAASKMVKCLDELNGQLSRTRWLAGDQFSLADIAVLPFVVRIGNLRPEMLEDEGRSAIAGWLARAGERPSFDRAIGFTEDPRAAELPNI